MIKILPSPELALHTAFLQTLSNVEPLQPDAKYVRVLTRVKGELLELNDMGRENVVSIQITGDRMFDVAHWHTSDGVSFHQQESFTFDKFGIAQAALKVHAIFGKVR